MKASTANRIWLFNAKRARRRFINDSRRPRERQTALLRAYLTANRSTEFGREHDFAELHDEADYRRAVPVRDRDAFSDYINQIADGRRRVLTNEPVLFFEETSGTSAFASIVPYTAGLKKEFQIGLNAWLRGLFERRPAAFAGPAYWSLSPPVRERRLSPGGLSIGATKDSEYFSPLTAYLLNKILAVPEALTTETDPDRFYLRTLAYLFEREDLSLISVWSPTFFLRLDGFLRENVEDLLRLLSNNLPPSRRRRIEKRLAGPFQWKDLWPGLDLLSCWTHAQSAFWIDSVRERLGKEGDVAIEGKGLLGTEGVVSIPVDAGDPVLAIGAHYYEFRDPANGTILAPDELTTGALYEPILTTGGGFYRYALGDIVECTGFFHSIPRLRFVGRNNRGCDLVGEKLTEYQVAKALGTAMEQTSIRFAYLTPAQDQGGSSSHPTGYLLHVAPGERTPEEAFARAVEIELERNPYYKQARDLGQLAPLKMIVTGKDMPDRLLEILRARGRTPEGNIKLPVLYPENPLAGERKKSDAAF